MLRTLRTVLLLAALAVSALACSPFETDSLQGYLEADYVYVAPALAGRLQELSVERGQIAAAGTPLFSLDPEPETSSLHDAEQRAAAAEHQLDDLKKGSRPSEISSLEARIAQAQASYQLAASELARTKTLAEQKIASVQDLDRAQSEVVRTRNVVDQLKADLATSKLGGRTDAIAAAESTVEAARAALKQARWALEQKTLRAPVEGTIYDTYYKPGEWIGAGRPVVSILAPGYLKIRFFVPEAMRPKFSPGTGLRIRLDGKSGELPATVTYLSAQAEFTPPVIYSKERREKLVYLAEAKFTEAVQLQPGQPVDVLPK